MFHFDLFIRTTGTIFVVDIRLIVHCATVLIIIWQRATVINGADNSTPFTTLSSSSYKGVEFCYYAKAF